MESKTEEGVVAGHCKDCRFWHCTGYTMDDADKESYSDIGMSFGWCGYLTAKGLTENPYSTQPPAGGATVNVFDSEQFGYNWQRVREDVAQDIWVIVNTAEDWYCGGFKARHGK